VFVRKEAALCWVLSGRMPVYSSLEKSSVATNRYSRGSLADCPISKRGPLGIEVNKLTWVSFVIALGGTFEAVL